MLRSQEDNESLTQLVQKLFAGWAKRATVDEVVSYVTGWRELTLEQIEAAVDLAIITGTTDGFPPSAAEVRRMAPTHESLHKKSSAKRDCSKCLGTGFEIVPRPDGHGKWAVKCECRAAN